jgi:hypothetical protein
MIDLDFISPPAPGEKIIIGNSKCGTLEIEIFGGLTTEEVAIIQKIETSTASVNSKIIDLAVTIEQNEFIRYIDEDGKKVKRKPSLLEAYSIAKAIFTGEEQDDNVQGIFLKYNDQIEAIKQYFIEYNNTRWNAEVTALIRSRLNRPDWNIKDNAKLPYELANAIYEVAQREQAVEKTDTSANEMTEEELGKQQSQEAKSESLLTGQESSTILPEPIQDNTIEQLSEKN